MPLPDADSLATAGGALRDYSPVIDPTTDRSAAGANAAYANAMAATHTQPRTITRVKWAGAGSPTILWHDEVWNNGSNPAPTVQRLGVGQGRIIHANGASGGTVVDEIASNLPGGNTNPHTLNLQVGWAGLEGATGALGCVFAVGCSNPYTTDFTFYTIVAGGVTLSDISNAVFNIFAR